MNEEASEILRRLRRRVVAQHALERLITTALATSGIVLAVGAVALARDAAPMNPRVIGAALAGTMAAAAVWIWRDWQPLGEFAALVDRTAHTRSRFQTALALTDAPAHPLAGLAVRECAEFVARFDGASWSPWRWPRRAPFLLVAVIALGFLSLQFHLRNQPNPAEQAATRQRADEAAAVARLAETIRRANEKTNAPELARAAEMVERSAARLREAHKGEDAQKAGLREFSSLEEMLRELQAAAQRPPSSPEELRALSEALQQNESTRAAGEQLASGDREAAGKALEQMLEQLRKNGGLEKTLTDLAQSMQQSAERLGDAQKQEVARQMQREAEAARAGQSSAAAAAMRELAQLLQHAGSRAAHGASEQASAGAQSLAQILDAIADLKRGLQSGRPNENQSGAGSNANERLAQMLAALSNEKPAQTGGPLTLTEGRMPSGQPGTERDGAGGNPEGEQRNPRAQAGVAARLEGTQSGGPSLQETLSTAGGADKSTRAYRELYSAMAPAAQEAVVQENIPLGSREMIKRYFGSIRPKE